MTFVADGQIRSFFICFLTGFLSLIPFVTFYAIGELSERKITSIICDIGGFLCLCGLYFVAVRRFMLPEIRLFSVLGVFLGLCFSRAIFNKPLAKVVRILYNILNKVKRKVKSNGKRKGEKAGNILGRNGGSVSRRADDRRGLPDDLSYATKQGVREPLQGRGKTRSRTRTTRGRHRPLASGMESGGNRP